MKKSLVQFKLFAIALLLAVFGMIAMPAFADGTQFAAGVGSSFSGSGGSFASSGTNGNGNSTQNAYSAGQGYAIGGTVIAGAVAYAPNIGAVGGVSGSFGGGASNTYTQSSGNTNGSGYGESKGGVGNDYSYAGYSNVTASYHY